MNPNTSVSQRSPGATHQTRYSAFRHAVEAALRWRLVDSSGLEVGPSWLRTVSGAALVLAGVLSLIASFRGGG